MKFIKRKKPPKQQLLKDKAEISPKTARIVFLSALGLFSFIVSNGEKCQCQCNTK